LSPGHCLVLAVNEGGGCSTHQFPNWSDAALATRYRPARGQLPRLFRVFIMMGSMLLNIVASAARTSHSVVVIAMLF
jgi:hypothetical protein